VRDSDHARALRKALEAGAFSPAQASRVIRALAGDSQAALAERLGLNVKVIKDLESGKGNPGSVSLQKLAAAFGLRLVFARASTSIGLLDPVARAEQEHRRRRADAEAIRTGRVSARELNERNALRLDGVTFELRELE
jgi:transcriptional regulator with XRE-family HTH domain